MSEPKKSARFSNIREKKPHVHGPGCKHDHGHEHGHVHAHEDKPHVHGPGCDHDHDHGHHHHAPRPKRIRPPGNRPAEGGGAALQLDLEGALPGETDEVGRFERLEAALRSHHGVTEVHLRRDAGHAEVCIHYQPEGVAPQQLLTLAQHTSATVAERYHQHTWFVRGMDSGDAAAVIEHAVSRMNGILSASVAYASERLVIEYDREALTLEDVEARVKSLGYALEVPTAGHVCSHHAHGGGLAPLLEMPLVVSAGVLLVVGWLLERFAPVPPWSPRSSGPGPWPVAASSPSRARCSRCSSGASTSRP
ncbi:cation transporter [Cystobacter fuscus]